MTTWHINTHGALVVLNDGQPGVMLEPKPARALAKYILETIPPVIVWEVRCDYCGWGTRDASVFEVTDEALKHLNRHVDRKPSFSIGQVEE